MNDVPVNADQAKSFTCTLAKGNVHVVRLRHRPGRQHAGERGQGQAHGEVSEARQSV